MVLHTGEADVGVHLPRYHVPCFECGGGQVQGGGRQRVGDDSVFFLYVHHGHVTEFTAVGVLTASLGEECGSVQHDVQGIGSFARSDGEDGGGEGLEVTVLIEQANGFHG